VPNRKLVISLVLLLLLGLGLYLFLKSKSQKPITERIYTKEKVTESEKALVEGYPNVPVYPGMRIDKTFRKEQEGKTDFVGVWYFEGGDEKVPEIMGWYTVELKKAGWIVAGPVIDEGQNEVQVRAENTQSKMRIITSKRYEEDEGGAGDILLIEILEK
jgi:hypothetical protein